jgi:hypothetical protein
MTQMAQEDQFRPPSLSGRCAFAEETFARASGNEKVAPIPVVRRNPMESPESTLNGPSGPRQTDGRLG